MNNTEIRFDEILNDCLEKVLQGMSVDACLSCYPQDSPRLKPLLETAIAARTACAVSPRPDFRIRARYELRCALARVSQPKPRLGFQWRWQLATIIPACISLLLIGTGGVIAASANSLPDQSLYSVKLATEQIQIRLTTSNTVKMKLYSLSIERRVGEIASMAEKGNTALVESTNMKLAGDLNIITGLVSPGAQQALAAQNGLLFGDAVTSPDLQSTGKSSQTTPPMAAFVPERTTALATVTDGAIVSSAAGPEPVPSRAVNAINIDPALLKFLQENAVKYPADLQALLDKVPEASRPGLLQAIALAANYQQVMNGLAANSPDNK